MNKEKISIVIAAVLVFVTVFALSGCHNAEDAATKVSDDEIMDKYKSIKNETRYF